MCIYKFINKLIYRYLNISIFKLKLYTYTYIYVDIYSLDIFIQLFFVFLDIDLLFINRKKFRSQTSDNMQRWKSRGGKSQSGAVKK